jgi:hypothetical protein
MIIKNGMKKPPKESVERVVERLRATEDAPTLTPVKPDPPGIEGLREAMLDAEAKREEKKTLDLSDLIS